MSLVVVVVFNELVGCLIEVTWLSCPLYTMEDCFLVMLSIELIIE